MHQNKTPDYFSINGINFSEKISTGKGHWLWYAASLKLSGQIVSDSLLVAWSYSDICWIEITIISQKKRKKYSAFSGFIKRSFWEDRMWPWENHNENGNKMV